MKKFFSIIIIISLCIFLSKNAIALKEETHAKINDSISKYADQYLINNLNLKGGIDENINGNSVRRWLSLGGIYEDARPVPIISSRSFMHFHDPTKPLYEAGYKNDVRTWDSSIIWALSDKRQSGLNLGDYSWPAARKYFYNALTATDKGTRENNFADCFRSVGQLMHLVEDVSVPEHTRNDGHITFNYETWVLSIQDDRLFNDMIANPVFPTVLSKAGYGDFGGIPLSRLFDTDQYDKSNPDITLGNGIGLAEYTNANFFSKHTAMNYEYPKDAISTFKNMTVINPDDTTQKIERAYYGKEGDGEPVEHLAAVSSVNLVFSKYYLQSVYDQFIFLDEYCYKDYASKLLPRTVGYASALMQYFFRGQIDAVDAKTEKDTSGITGITLKVKNATPGEDMSGGKLVVSYNYQKDGSTHYGKSGGVTITNIPTNNSTTDDTYKYSFTFSPAIPSDATDKKYMLVYRGKLGQEDDAVAGKAFEETPIWSYLFIKQREYKIKTTSSCGPVIIPAGTYCLLRQVRSDFIFDNCEDMNVNGYLNINAEFDLEWAGRKDKITDISLEDNPYSAEIKELTVVPPTKENPSGNLKINFTLRNYASVYGAPRLKIITEDNQGNKAFYLEPIIFSVNAQSSQAFIQDYPSRYAGSSFAIYSKYSYSTLVPDKIAAQFFSTEYKYINNQDYTECYQGRIRNEIYESKNNYTLMCWDQAISDDCKPYPNYQYDYTNLLDFFTVHSKIIKIKREWNNSFLYSLRLKGYDTSKFVNWEIPVECWVTDKYQ